MLLMDTDLTNQTAVSIHEGVMLTLLTLVIEVTDENTAKRLDAYMQLTPYDLHKAEWRGGLVCNRTGH